MTKLKKYDNSDSIPNRVPCPECGYELVDVTSKILEGSLYEVNVLCERCGYKGIRKI